MLPFLTFGRFSLPTFGLMLALAAACSIALLHRNIRRYGLALDAASVIASAMIAGVIGAKLWHALQDPALLLAEPSVLLDRSGLAWFGGLFGGIAALCWKARVAQLRMLTLLDLCAPAAALGYGIGRIGCFTSGDGDYGVASSLPWAMSFPHGTVPVDYPVHPTPLYECIVACALAAYLWRRGAPSRGVLSHPAQVTGEYLVLSGLARFLVEFIRINPRLYWGMSNAQLASVLSVVAGIVLIAYARRHGAKPVGHLQGSLR